MTKKSVCRSDAVNPTEEYINENEYVMSLERRIIVGKPRFRYSHPLLAFLLRIYRIIKNCATYAIEIIAHRKRFFEIIKLRGVKNKFNALVIGNGPSQGYLSAELLGAFKENGGEIFAVNFWHLNVRLSSVKPDYLVISDPATLSFKSDHEILKNSNLSLLSYLKSNNSIKIVCPFSREEELRRLFDDHRIICFSDTELIGISKNIAPIYPRGYISMTLYKALSVALWFGYKKVYIIGMDNTYPRNIFCDSNNRILNLERHAGIKDTVADQSAVYRNIAELLEDLTVLFKDIWKFSGDGKVVNLDQYSLTDAFVKMNIQVFEEILNAEKGV